MRTTVRLDDNLLRDAKVYAARHGRTLTSLIEEGLRRVINGRPVEPLALPTRRGGRLQPGVDLDSNAALIDLMEEGLPLEKLR